MSERGIKKTEKKANNLEIISNVKLSIKNVLLKSSFSNNAEKRASCFLNFYGMFSFAKK